MTTTIQQRRLAIVSDEHDEDGDDDDDDVSTLHLGVLLVHRSPGSNPVGPQGGGGGQMDGSTEL